MERLETLRDRIIKQGTITPSEVGELREVLYSGDGMDIVKGTILFEIKDALLKGKSIPEFKRLFVEAITKQLLEDERSFARIDKEEAQWLRRRIQYVGNYDSYDRALIENLRKKSTNFPKILEQKSRSTRLFENVLYI